MCLPTTFVCLRVGDRLVQQAKCDFWSQTAAHQIEPTTDSLCGCRQVLYQHLPPAGFDREALVGIVSASLCGVVQTQLQGPTPNWIAT